MLHASASAQKLGALRIIVFGLLLGYVITTPIEYLSYLPPQFHVRMGLLRLLPDDLWGALRSTTGLMLLRGLIAAGALLCVLGTRGYRAIALSTVSLWLVFEGSLYLGAASHRELATLYCAVILAVFPAADGLSVRARGNPDKPRPSEYAAAMQLMAFSLCFTYAVTAFYRLAHGSPQVFWGDSMLSHLVGNADRNGTFGFTYGAQLARTLGPSTLVLNIGFFIGTLFEALALVCFFSRWFRVAFIAFALAFHTINLLGMNIEFTLNMVLAVALLIEWDPWRSARGSPRAASS